MTPRDGAGRFLPGPENKGRAPGSKDAKKRQIAELFRESLAAVLPGHLRDVFADPVLLTPRGEIRVRPTTALMELRQNVVAYMTDRGYGKAPKEIVLPGDEATVASTLEDALLALHRGEEFEEPVPQTAAEETDAQDDYDDAN